MSSDDLIVIATFTDGKARKAALPRVVDWLRKESEINQRAPSTLGGREEFRSPKEMKKWAQRSFDFYGEHFNYEPIKRSEYRRLKLNSKKVYAVYDLAFLPIPEDIESFVRLAGKKSILFTLEEGELENAKKLVTGHLRELGAVKVTCASGLEVYENGLEALVTMNEEGNGR